jgi:hypothetical protein
MDWLSYKQKMWSVHPPSGLVRERNIEFEHWISPDKPF